MENDFSVIDRLVAFGIEASFASSLVSKMNDAMSGMKVPGAMANGIPADHEGGRLWYARIDGRTVGPMEEKEVMACLLEKRIGKDSFVWSHGMPQWKRVEEVPEILKLVMLLPPEL